MKAVRRNAAGRWALMLVSVAVLTLGLVGVGGSRFDLIAELFGPLLVLGRGLSSVAVLGILYRLAFPKGPSPVPVRVRA
jgi:uncharacterized membrane protein YuzA (DUF378 family)